jgi:hypothetical protein
MRRLSVNCSTSSLGGGSSLMGIRLIELRLFLGMIILNTESNFNTFIIFFFVYDI